ncbi:HupE / UreJ protein [Anatilimnocola aggregata]|uniref:HupE / UreJ protein n=1 Tax=Anatilimnocola aggregata TaxID=2528021 RepID=A0A517Y6Z6_9BACT|nr:HupE/UreJ family protein [Anatilimnocola aggregata]QDU26003.1 HupE / UreJ protein [Anatilimnocola aggregata]
MNLRTAVSVLGLIVVTCQAAWGHPGHTHTDPTGSGLHAGFFHPLLGLDHLLAMFAVGLLATQIGGRAMWALPAAFLGMMIVGGGLGIAGFAMPGIEIAIALTVVTLGIALAFGRKYPLLAAAVVIGLFGLLHGHAHGTEMPGSTQPVMYAMGFILATAGLHLAGVGAGLLFVRGQQDPLFVRLSGAAISLAGVMILLGAI